MMKFISSIIILLPLVLSALAAPIANIPGPERREANSIASEESPDVVFLLKSDFAYKRGAEAVESEESPDIAFLLKSDFAYKEKREASTDTLLNPVPGSDSDAVYKEKRNAEAVASEDSPDITFLLKSDFAYKRDVEAEAEAEE